LPAQAAGIRNPWIGLASSPPYVTAEDDPYIRAWNHLPAVADSPFYLQLDLPPEPFAGPHHAPLVVLSANPGWAVGDAEIYHRLGAAERLAEITTDGGARFRRAPMLAATSRARRRHGRG
jgi:hypothetical protein